MPCPGTLTLVHTPSEYLQTLLAPLPVEPRIQQSPAPGQETLIAPKPEGRLTACQSPGLGLEMGDDVEVEVETERELPCIPRWTAIVTPATNAATAITATNAASRLIGAPRRRDPILSITLFLRSVGAP
jgi:hypothetical protein